MAQPGPPADDLTPLLQRAISGDGPALDALLRRLRPYVHALVRARLGPEPGDGLDRSALVQDCLMRIYQNVGHLRGQEAPRLLGWVRQIVRHRVIDALRTKRHEPGKVPLADPPDPAEPTEPGAVLQGAERRETQILRVAEALDRLSGRRRQVVELSFFDQLSDAEIGERLGGSAGAVRVLRFRALQDLHRLLAETLDPDDRTVP